MEENFDFIVAGAGMAGVAVANRLCRHLPNARVLLLEKENYLGGRLRSLGEHTVDEKSGTYGYGLCGVSPELVDFFADFTSIDPGEVYNLATQNRLGILAAARVQEIDLHDMMTPVGFRALGGAAAARDWKNMASIWQDDDSESLSTKEQDKNFLTFWKGQPKKSPAAIVLQHYARVLGIADTWTASIGALRERTHWQTSGLKIGTWETLLAKLSEEEKDLTVHVGCRIAKADKLPEGGWSLVTEKGTFTAKSLVVAQPPWQALDWLPKVFWPKEVLALTTKTTPVSAVTLSTRVTKGNFEDLCDAYVIPAEEVQIVKGINGELCFQSTIDYENSLQSANVVKSVKKLKRSFRKFLEAYPEYELSGEYIALVPVAWSQSPDSESQKYIRDFNMSAFCAKELSFCGDAYGASYDGDKNMSSSLNSTFAAMTSKELT